MRHITEYNVLKSMKFMLLIGFCAVLAIGIFSCGDGDDDGDNTEPVIDAFHMRLEQAVVNYEGPIFDWHQHLPFFQNKNVYLQQLLSEMNSLGVTCGVFMASATDALDPANYDAVFSRDEAQKLYNITVEFREFLSLFLEGSTQQS
jgi:hypothetical protein